MSILLPPSALFGTAMSIETLTTTFAMPIISQSHQPELNCSKNHYFTNCLPYETTYTVCDPKHGPYLKKRQHFSVQARDLKFVQFEGICMYSRSLQFHYPIWNSFVRIKLFILPSLWHNDNISVKKKYRLVKNNLFDN
jgi:hypothetical protein